jgi:hypothetical protein
VNYCLCRQGIAVNTDGGTKFHSQFEKDAE